jgi:transcriptional regulator with XRE-family HTH domain
MSNEKIKAKLRTRFRDAEYAHAYMETFFNAAIATQIKVLREQRGLTQGELAELTAMKQERISVLENVDYGTWNVKTLRRLAEAFDVVLKVSFETFGQAIEEVGSFSRETLQRSPRAEDLRALSSTGSSAASIAADADSASASRFGHPREHHVGRGVLLQDSWLVASSPAEHQFEVKLFEPFKMHSKPSLTAASMAMI